MRLVSALRFKNETALFLEERIEAVLFLEERYVFTDLF